ncbi:PREDICTED: Golgi-associated plant pathogenesis-related protein 1-like [Amphimedon queenslandica]|uniref:SCP domain-containing protein n=1 Tax=Amphimedon queenslandica TaxID=400682 RepID=A0A1X7V1D1_AMPQE|nr:PREDICTED: Golgi-associated plant pathogenesis-related protein 1-like [Amphimedon queenslandica]|eukprot:XP_003386119.1 PREDICTED: Golgi-associated plant pathogenesis-related protein 1-like [Amphimedon queenslandica]
MGCCCCKGSNGPDEFSKDLLAAHNRYRRKHGSPPLKWSAEAAAKAQEWADHLASTGSLQHGNHDGMGQNLAYYSGGTLTASYTAEMWYNEIKDYSFDRPGFSSSTGHFTQLLWASSKEAGFGYTVRGQTTYVVANYLPAGNVQGRFEQNVKPAV